MIFDHRSYWIPKDLEDRKAYQDAFETDAEKGIASIADGASSSLFAGRWARLLAEATVRRPITPESPHLSDWLDELRQAWAEPIDENELAWHQKAKLRDGAHATLLWLNLFHDDQARRNEWKFIAHGIGDCCLFHVHDEQVVQVFPLTRSEEFTASPATIGSAKASEKKSRDSWLEMSGTCAVGDTIVLATDALAAWGVREMENNRDPNWLEFWDIPASAFEDRIRQMRDDNLIRYDDTTLLVLRLLEPTEDSADSPTIVDALMSTWARLRGLGQ
jgi:hypothetical protein